MRLFSSADQVFTDQRNHLAADRTEMIILVKHSLPTMNCDYRQHCEMDFHILNFCCELVSCRTKGLVTVCCWICDVMLWTSDCMLVTTGALYCTLLLDKGALKTITSPSHGRLFWPIVSPAGTIGFLHYCPNHNRNTNYLAGLGPRWCQCSHSSTAGTTQSRQKWSSHPARKL